MAYPGSLRQRRSTLGSMSDQDVYSKSLNAAKAYGLNTQNAQAAPYNIQRGQAGVQRRRDLYAGLQRRTTESSRRRLLKRILQGYGVNT